MIDSTTQEIRKRSERTLVSLTVTQSTLTTVRMITLTSFYMFVYTVSDYIGCGGWLFASAVDATFELTDILEFYLILAFNPEIRKTVKQILKCCGSAVEVTPVQPLRGHQ